MFDTVDTHPTEPVTAIAAGVEGLAAEDRGYWHATTLSDRLIELLTVQERFDAEITRFVGQWSTMRTWEEHPELGDALAAGNVNAGRRTPPR